MSVSYFTKNIRDLLTSALIEDKEIKMKKFNLLLILLFLMIIPTEINGEELTERVIITFKKEIDYQLLELEALEIHHVFEELQTASVTIPKSTQERLLYQDQIHSIEVESIVKIDEQERNWGYQTLTNQTPNIVELKGENVKIAILDTGIDTNHPDLIVSGGETFVTGATTFQDDQGHGTHIAGIIAAQDNDIGIVGIAPKAKIYSVKVLNKFGEGFESDVIKGIEWAVEQKMDIINLSFTTTEESQLLKGILQKAYDQGILIVAAAGNSYVLDYTNVLYPARYSSVMAVGSINKELTHSSFSFFGYDLDFVAPGEDILSTYISPDGYIEASGTSMSTAFVSGIAALYKQKYPTFSNKEIRIMMQNHTKDLGQKGKDLYYGYGLVDFPSTTKGFTDVKSGIWYEEEVNYLSQLGIITGYPDGTFQPQTFITRAEAVTMLGRAINLIDKQSTTVFPDVPIDHYASGYIYNASANEIVKGFPDQTFKPDSYIKRGDVAVILQRSYKYPQVSSNYFLDNISGKYYFSAINSLRDKSITNGYPNGTFRPELKISRAEFGMMLAKAIQEKNSLHIQ